MKFMDSIDGWVRRFVRSNAWQKTAGALLLEACWESGAESATGTI